MSLIDRIFGPTDWKAQQVGSAQFYDFGSGYTGWQPTGDDVVEFKIIEPPDDRYIPGYSRTEADGDKKIVMPRLKDLNVPFSLYGLPIPITFGVRRLYGNIIWAVPLKENVKKQTDSGSGGPRKVTWEYEYFATYAVAFGYASEQIGGSRDIIRIWLDGTLAYDRRAAGEVKIEGLNFVYYDGSETQVADPTIEAREGVGNVPGYRGMQYIVIKDLPVMDFGNRPPSVSIEVGDATSEAYSVTNIDATAGGLYPVTDVQTASLVDWSYMYAFTFTDGADGIVRTYDLTTNQVVLAATPNPDGIGWKTNGSDSFTTQALMYKKGIRATITGLTYLTGSQKVFGSASGIGRTPVMLLDPFTGLVLKWCGVSSLGTTMAYPEVPDGAWPKTGQIPIYRQACGQLVYTLTTTEQYIFLDNFYSVGGLMCIKEEEEGLNPIKIFEGVKVKQIVPGPRRLGFSWVMVIPEGSNIVQFYKITAGAGRSRIVPATPTVKPGLHTTWGVVYDTSMSITCPAAPQNVVYFEFDNSVIIFMANGQVRKYTLNLADEFDLTFDVNIGVGNLPDAYLQNMDLNNVEYGFLGYQTADGVLEFDLTFGTVKTYAAIDSHFFANGKLFNSQRKTIAGIAYSGGGGYGEGQTASKNTAFSIGYYDILNDSQVALADILKGLAVYAGYSLSEIEVDPAIDDMVDGAIITEVTTFRSIIDPITALYRIDCIESDGKVKFKRKSLEYDTVDYTVLDGECLLDNPTDIEGSTFVLRREEEQAIPERVQVRYIDKGLSYNWSMVMATRSREVITNDSETQITYQVPIIMTAEQAKLLGTRALWYGWSSRVSYSFRLPYRFLKIEPGDVGLVQAGGLEYKVKSVQVSYNNDFSLSITGTSFQSDEAVSVIAGSPSGYPQTIPTTLPPVMFVFDIPLLRAQDDANFSSQFPVYFYTGPAKVNVTFTGAIAEMGFNSTQLSDAGVNKIESIVCKVINAPEVDEGLIGTLQEDVYLDVVPVSGDPTLLESCTFDELLDGANVAAWGRTFWEIIQFQTVEQISARRFRLSGILRGRRGSETGMSYHAPGDTLVLLKPSAIQAKKFTFADIGRTLFYKATSVTGSKSSAPQYQSLQGYAAYSWVPSAVHAERLIGGDQSLQVSWSRRSRTYGDLLDGGQSIPLGSTELNKWKVLLHRRPYYIYTYNTISDEWEAEEGYDDATEFETATPSVTFSAAEQRSANLFEYDVPDDLEDPATTFTRVNGSNHPDNLADYQHMLDLGYDQWHAFKWVDVTIYQGYLINGEEGYGVGRKQRVYIKDV